jgi:CO/xanthine dehydrogenase Mo-binding subunit
VTVAQNGQVKVDRVVCAVDCGAEVPVAQNGQVKVDRVVCAVDCGTPINPDVITAQMEGGIGFGLGAALYGAITLKDGKVEQTNFDAYQVLRIDEMPKEVRSTSLHYCTRVVVTVIENEHCLEGSVIYSKPRLSLQRPQ